MAKILLDYAFPVSIIDSLPSASTGWLKKPMVVVKPNTANEENVGEVFSCTSIAQVEALTDNEEVSELFNAGVSSILVLLADDLDIASIINSKIGEFFTLLISSDFSDADLVQLNEPEIQEVKASITLQNMTFTSKLVGALGNAQTIEITSGATAGAEVVTVDGDNISIQIEVGETTLLQIKTALEASVSGNAKMGVTIASGQDATEAAVQAETNLAGGVNFVAEVPEVQHLTLGQFTGVVGIQSQDLDVIANQATKSNRAAFLSSVENGAKNMFFAFGKLLSNQLNWLNQQYITMPYNDGIDVLGEANNLFDLKASFVLNDDEFGNVLGLFAAQGKAIVAPYIIANLKLNLQSRAIQWIYANQPQYTIQEAKLLEDALDEDVIQNFIQRRWIESGTVEIRLENDNFVASGYINVSEPKALWRVFSELRQTL